MMLPGDRVLVVGNHEFVKNRSQPKDHGFEAPYPTLVRETDPPLLLTNEPCRPARSTRGHLHGMAARRLAGR